MRVIAGAFRSRKLVVPIGMDVRPTSDRLRETLFSVLAPRVEGARFLDLFAGTGAVGIEALSRGAAECVFVESEKRVSRILRSNLSSLGIAAEVYERPAAKAVALLSSARPMRSFDIVFLDPPYAVQGAYEATLHALSSSTLLAPEALVIAEHDKRFTPPKCHGDLSCYRRLLQGDTGLSFYRKDPQQ